MKNRIAFALAAALALSGCATAGSVLSKVVVAATSSTPSQAKTVGEAAQAATLVEHAVDIYANTGTPNAAVLHQLHDVILPAIHNALVKAEAANKSGNSALAAATISAFNEALADYRAYAVNQGIAS